MSRLSMSSAMPAELAERLSDVADSQSPDFTDADELPVCKSLQEPLAQLFSTRDQVRLWQRMQALDKDKALEWLLRDIEAIEAVCVRLWDEA